MDNEKPYFVYALVDPRDDVIFYIGEGKAYRPEDHFIEAALRRNQGEKVNKIREIWDSENEVKLIRLAKDFLTQQQALEIESLFLIEARQNQEVLGLTCNLTNLAKGDYEKSFREWNHPEIIPGFDYQKRAVESAETYEGCKPLYAHIIEKLPEFRNAISITDQHIRTQPQENGFEFVLKPKKGKFIYFEYIARSETEEQIKHAEMIRHILGEEKSFAYAKVEREIPSLRIDQLEQVEMALRKFIEDVYSAERRIQKATTR